MALDILNITKGLITNFYQGYDAADPQAQQIAMTVPSTAASENYGWLGSVPSMRLMNGERVPVKLLEYKYTLANIEYEASVEVKRADIMDDQTGKYAPLVKNIGATAKTFPDQNIFGNLLPNGFTNLAYDGSNFFATTHPVGNTGTTQSNTISTALSGANYATARAMLRRMVDDFGNPVNQNMKLLLIVPPELEGTANTILNAEHNADGSDNVYYHTADVLVSPWLVSATHWYLANVTGPVMPFVIQNREFIPFESLEDGSEDAFWRKKFYYGTYWRGNFGYALYQKIVGSSN